MPARPIPHRHWRSYGNDPLPTAKEAMDEPFRAFPSWFLRITCDRCGKDRMLSETHFPRSDMLIRDIIARGRHDGCGGSETPESVKAFLVRMVRPGGSLLPDAAE